ncbi:MAG: hypothetical protein ACOCWM_05040 [Cyclobacteriaceae bacterium]
MKYKSYSEVWFVKRKSNSTPEKVILFFDSKMHANMVHSKAIKENDARIFFGNDYPKEVSACWQ